MLGVRPECDLRPVQILDRVRPARVLASRSGHLVAAAQLGEVQLGVAVVLRRWPERVVTQLVVVLGDAEQVLRSCIEVGDDHRALAEAHARPFVEPRGNVGADALLPPLEHNHTHPALLGQLLLNSFVQQALGVVPHERQDVSRLVADFQVLGAVQLVVNHEARKDLICY